MRRKIAVVMAADVVGYSRLMAEDEEETVRRLMSCRAVFDDFVAQAHGRVFNTAGDAVLAEFPSAVEALRAAIEIQESIRTRNLAYPEGRQMRFRIGMTVGDVIERDGDLLGDAVNIAARLEGLAKPGGICVSSQFHDQVSTKVAVTFSDIGAQTVKNIPRSVQAFLVSGEPEPVLPHAPRRLRIATAALAILALGAGAGWIAWRHAGTTIPIAAPAPVASLVQAPAPVGPDASCTYSATAGRVTGQILFFANSPWRRAESLSMDLSAVYRDTTSRTHTEAIRDSEGYSFDIGVDPRRSLVGLTSEISAPSGLIDLTCLPG